MHVSPLLENHASSVITVFWDHTDSLLLDVAKVRLLIFTFFYGKEYRSIGGISLFKFLSFGGTRIHFFPNLRLLRHRLQVIDIIDRISRVGAFSLFQ